MQQLNLLRPEDGLYNWDRHSTKLGLLFISI